jgi:hypothetical protein
MTMSDEPKTPIMQVPKDLSREELSIAFRVIEAMRGMRFGSVQLQIHEGKVVQIDVAEKLRIRHPARGSGPPPFVAPAQSDPSETTPTRGR